LSNRHRLQQEEWPLTVYTDRLRAYDPLEKDKTYQREAIIHVKAEYVDGDAHVERVARPWLSPHQGISKNKLTA